MENWSQILLFVIAGLIGVFTGSALIAGLFVGLLVSWKLWLGSFISWSNFQGMVLWALGFFVMFFMGGFIAGFFGAGLASMLSVPQWNDYVGLVSITLIGLHFLTPIAIERKIKREEERVAEFVSSNESVKTAVGDVLGAYHIKEQRSRWALMPSGYKVSVGGSNRVAVVLTASRSLWSPVFFTLISITLDEKK